MIFSEAGELPSFLMCLVMVMVILALSTTRKV